MKTNIKHNKLRNTGILFELLVRQVTVDVMDNKKNSVAVKLMREFFNSKTELGKELILYRAFFNSSNLSENKAFQLLNLLSEQRKKLNNNALSLQKYLLIKEIKANFNLKEFLSVRIPSYKVYASIYKVFDAATNGVDNISSVEELATSQFTIVEHLSANTQPADVSTQLSETLKKLTPEVRNKAYQILLDKFNEKYNGLNDKQKKLLKEYIFNLPTSSKLREYVTSESEQLSGELEGYAVRVTDSVIKIKLSEVCAQLNKLKNVQVLKENHLTSMLIGYEILKELKELKK